MRKGGAVGDLYERARAALAFGGPWRCAWTPYCMRRIVAPAIKGARLSREEASGLVGAVPTGYERQKLDEALRDDSVAPDGRGLQLIVDDFEERRRYVGRRLIEGNRPSEHDTYLEVIDAQEAIESALWNDELSDELASCILGEPWLPDVCVEALLLSVPFQWRDGAKRRVEDRLNDPAWKSDRRGLRGLIEDMEGRRYDGR